MIPVANGALRHVLPLLPCSVPVLFFRQLQTKAILPLKEIVTIICIIQYRDHIDKML